MCEELVRGELERRFYGYALSEVRVTEFRNGRGWVDFLLGQKSCSAEFSLDQGSVYIVRGPQDDFYNEYPLIKPNVDPMFDFSPCCERAFNLTKHNGKVTNLALVKRWERESWIEFRCDRCGARLRFDQAGARAPWSKIL